MRSFNPEEFDVGDIGEPSAWVGKRTPAGIRAVPVAGERNPLTRVLTQHMCAQYREAKDDERLAVGTAGDGAVENLRTAWGQDG